MKWLDELKEYREKLGTDMHAIDSLDYNNFDWFPKEWIDRLIEIAEREEYSYLCPSGRKYCNLCGALSPDSEDDGLTKLRGHAEDCPYSDEWKP